MARHWVTSVSRDIMMLSGARIISSDVHNKYILRRCRPLFAFR